MINSYIKTYEHIFNAIKAAEKASSIALNLAKLSSNLKNVPGFKTLVKISYNLNKNLISKPEIIQNANIKLFEKLSNFKSSSNPIEHINNVQNCFYQFFQDIISLSNLSPEDQKYLLFFVNNFFDAIVPNNSIFLNTQALNGLLKSNFQSLFNGIENFYKDSKCSRYFFNIANVDKNCFKVGHNIATTEGKVLFENELIELIHYKPKNKAHSIPLLIVPPWINKFYILDLSKEKSFINWLTDNNFQVFLISWINPTSKDQDFSFEDYLNKGLIQSIKYIQSTFNIDKINALGYCIGGTLLSIATAISSVSESPFINSATFLTTLLDFSNAGILSTFIREEIIEEIESQSQKNGFLDGAYIFTLFNMLKPKDLIWNSYITNYLLGKKPSNFDILYWNSDYTNLPAKMISFYLRNIYFKNLLVSKKLNLLGTNIDLSTIKIPTFFVATQNDHIVPWESVYNSARYLENSCKTFCLAASGHVAGIVNPPDQNKYSYFTHENLNQSSRDWLCAAKESSQNGSWWKNYSDWLKDNSGKLTKSSFYSKLNEIRKAPGINCIDLQKLKK